MSKKIKILFTVSVLLNLLLGGVMAGHMFRPPSFMENMSQDMSPEGRNIVARVMQKAFREGEDNMRALRESKAEITGILNAPEFDAAKFEEAARKMHALRSEMGMKRIEITREMAEQLSLSDRRLIAENFAKGFHGRGKGEYGKLRPFLKDFSKERVGGERAAGPADDPSGADSADIPPGDAPPPKLPEDMPPPPGR